MPEPTPLFKSDVTKTFESIVANLFKNVDRASKRLLSQHAEVFGESPRDGNDLRRILRRAVKEGAIQMLDTRSLSAINQNLTAELPCDSAQLRERLAARPIRSVDEEMCLLLLYGYRHGLSSGDLDLLPISSFGLTFKLDGELSEAQLSQIEMRPRPGMRGVHIQPCKARVNAITRTGNTLVSTLTPIGDAEFVFEIDFDLADLIGPILDFIRWLIAKWELSELEDDLEDLEEDLEKLDEAIEKLEKFLNGCEKAIANMPPGFPPPPPLNGATIAATRGTLEEMKKSKEEDETENRKVEGKD